MTSEKESTMQRKNDGRIIDENQAYRSEEMWRRIESGSRRSFAVCERESEKSETGLCSVKVAEQCACAP